MNKRKKDQQSPPIIKPFVKRPEKGSIVKVYKGKYQSYFAKVVKLCINKTTYENKTIIREIAIVEPIEQELSVFDVDFFFDESKILHHVI